MDENNVKFIKIILYFKSQILQYMTNLYILQQKRLFTTILQVYEVIIQFKSFESMIVTTFINCKSKVNLIIIGMRH